MYGGGQHALHNIHIGPQLISQRGVFFSHQIKKIRFFTYALAQSISSPKHMNTTMGINYTSFCDSVQTYD
ncbi:hypothetical protein A0H81_02247 [Grifola frondosa]|uniref:Uncharacterized protein n=1 Tax=Grifola frondosa TaxID=5627 RepID=A0A1C7MPM5_GRIFR|nr:hypothetical protein A0H81_02247 [Grifola frondosa]